MKFMNMTLGFAALSLGACGLDVSAPERLLQSMYDKSIIAERYDVTCNGGKSTTPMNENLGGNLQVIQNAYAAEILRSHPEKSQDEIAAILEARKTQTGKAIGELLRDKGCESVAGEKSAEVLKNMMDTVPAEMASTLEEKRKVLEGK